MQDHNRIQCNGNEIAVINHDGTPSHNSDLSVVPNWVLGWIKDKKLTESYLATMPPEVIVEAARHETGMAQAVEFMKKTKGP
jgi:hypothetical protein